MPEETTALVMCMDSNERHLNKRKLWDLDGTKYEKCYTLDQVNRVVDRSVKYTKLKYFLIAVGCNDLDEHEAYEVFGAIRNIVTKLQHMHHGIKVIIGEITPRMDNRDSAVQEVNASIKDLKDSNANVYVIRNSNLRNSSFFRDNKHIRQEHIARYAANIKHTLRVAYGRRKYVSPSQDSNRRTPYQQNRQQAIQQQHYPENQHLEPQQPVPQQQQQIQQQQQNQQQQQQQQQALQYLLWILNQSQNLTPFHSRVSDTLAIDTLGGFGT